MNLQFSKSKYYKLYSFIFLFVLIKIPTAIAQNLEYDWISQAGGSDIDYGERIDILNTGSTYMCSRFNDVATFGDTSLAGSGSTLALGYYNSKGILNWIKSFGGDGMSNIKKIKSDSDGNILTVGSFWDELSIENTTLISHGARDMFFMKYDSLGHLFWIKQAGGELYDTGDDITLDTHSNIIITGTVQDTSAFGDTTIISETTTSYYIAKYDAQGSFKWAKTVCSTIYNSRVSIATDLNDNIYITGHFSDTTTIGDTILTSKGKTDVFLAKYNDNGNFKWVIQAGGSGYDSGHYLGIDSDNNIISTGSFSGTVYFSDTSLVSAGLDDIFFVKHNNTGDLIWARSVGGSQSETDNDVAIDVLDNFYVIGGFKETAYFGPHMLSSNGEWDIFVLKINPAGEFEWTLNYGGEGWENSGGIDINVNNEIGVIGSFEDAISIGDTTLISAGKKDIFSLKFHETTTSIIDSRKVSEISFILAQNYPNPFNPTTSISYHLKTKSNVQLTVYDISGRLIKTLVDEHQNTGQHAIIFNAIDLASGIYFYKLKTGAFEQSRKMVLLR